MVSKRKLLLQGLIFRFHVKLQGISVFFDGPPIIRSTKSFNFSQISTKKSQTDDPDERYVLWHNLWRVWVQKPLIGSSSQVWVWKDITNGDQEEKKMSLFIGGRF